MIVSVSVQQSAMSYQLKAENTKLTHEFGTAS